MVSRRHDDKWSRNEIVDNVVNNATLHWTDALDTTLVITGMQSKAATESLELRTQLRTDYRFGNGWQGSVELGRIAGTKNAGGVADTYETWTTHLSVGIRF